MSGDDLTDSDDLGRKMMRQVTGSFMEYKKGRLVAKLRHPGTQAQVTGKKVGGRKSQPSCGRRWLPKPVAFGG